MRRLLLISLFGLCIFQTLRSQNVSVCVDERLELTCVLWRLAGIDGFVNECSPTYTREVDSYFDNYASHPLIDYVKCLDLVSSEIVASAFTFDIKDKHIIPNEEKFTALFHLGKSGYWSEDSYRKYISLLDDFYRISNFGLFFEILYETYEKSQLHASEILSNVDLTWFSQHFTNGCSDVKVYLGLCLGNHNYSVTRKELSMGDIPIVMGCNGEYEGFPVFEYPDLAADIFVHEINHFYVRPIIDGIYRSIELQIEFICNHMKNRGLLLPYLNPKVLANEWMTELFTALYKCDNWGDYAANYYIDYCMDKGFVWMHRSFICLKNYRNDRKQYGTLNEFSRHIVDHLKTIPNDWELIIDEANHKNPYILNVFPANGSELNVNQSEIRITFSKPMRKDVHGVSCTELYPMIPCGRGEWIDDYTYTIKLCDINTVDSGTYGFVLPKYCYISNTCSPLKNDQCFYYKISK